MEGHLTGIEIIFRFWVLFCVFPLANMKEGMGYGWMHVTHWR